MAPAAALSAVSGGHSFTNGLLMFISRVFGGKGKVK